MLDGEAVVLGVDGVSDFDALHSRKHDDEVQFCAFDIMVEGDDDLRKLPLHLRKTNLQRLLARRPEGVFINPFETVWAFRGWRQQRREASPKPMSSSKSNETLRAYVRLTHNSGARADIPCAGPIVAANVRPAMKAASWFSSPLAENCNILRNWMAAL